MKNLSEQLQRYDRENFRRVAHGMPEIHEQPSAVSAEQTAEVFNSLFSQLRATFPAAMANFKTQDEYNEFRRQWLLAFKENGITTMDQVNAGMRVARRQERPFLPSPGQFVAWCRESAGVLNVTVESLMTEYWQWRKDVFRYDTSEQFPWSQPVVYHICLELRHRGTDGQLSEKELLKEAGALLAMWEKRVIDGKPIPPVRRALAAPTAPQGPTPIQLLLAKRNRLNDNGTH